MSRSWHAPTTLALSALVVLVACGEWSPAARDSSPDVEAIPFGTDLVPRDESRLSPAALAGATARWEASAPQAYRWLIEGDGENVPQGVSINVSVDNGVVVDGPSEIPGAERFTVDAMLRRIADDLASGRFIAAEFEPRLGYPTWIHTESAAGDVILDVLTREFEAIDRPEGCVSTPGSATDLASEPLAQLAYRDHDPHRWTDARGCPVRIDVIAQGQGPEHCGWESITFLSVGSPIGAPIADTARRRYVRPREPRPTTSTAGEEAARHAGAPITELPAGVVDTGFRDDDAQLWADPSDPTAVYRVEGDTAEAWSLVGPEEWVCM